MRQYSLIAVFLLPALLSLSCKKERDNKVPGKEVSLTTAPVGFPEIPFPDENPFTLAKWELGKKLFYDKALSVDYSTSCGSCHPAASAFSDVISRSIGAHNTPGRRNAPTLTNVAYQPYYTREGGVPTLEKQILVPIQEHDEFDFNIVLIAERLNKMPQYVQMSRAVFGRDPDPYVITRAIATFERTLVSGNSNYDRYINWQDSSDFNSSAQRGMRLFNSDKTNCNKCHNGLNFTNYSFENNGLYEHYNDPGRLRLTNKEADRALFKVPTLRNIALTAPYMHDGSIQTLDAVIAHYNSGGKNHPHKSSLIKPLGLTTKEQRDLLAFLQSLTDNEFINKKEFYNEEQ